MRAVEYATGLLFSGFIMIVSTKATVTQGLLYPR